MTGAICRLRLLARLCGVAPCYQDYEAKRVATRPDLLVRLIDALSGEAPLGSDPDAARIEAVIEAIRARRTGRGLSRVIVAWNGRLDGLWFWSEGKTGTFSLELTPEEGGGTLTLPCRTDAVFRRRGQYRIKLSCADAIPFDYYMLRILCDGKSVAESFVVVAPERLKPGARCWGVFAPAYALRGEPDQGIGGFEELGRVASFIKAQGGAFVGTLPLLPCSYEGDAPDPSPYAPVSRLFWNEIFLDTADLPGYEGESVADEGGDMVDYASVYRRKAAVIQRAADSFFALHPEGDAPFRDYAARTPFLRDYAAFRARGDAEAERFHLYAQYACHIQFSALKDGAEAGRLAALYLDYPVGVHPAGFDAVRFSSLFLRGFHVGAPPDLFFSKGQNWGFQPYDPRALSADRFLYFRATLHHYFRYARMIRLDHIMGLYRLYCIPEGHSAGEGAYIYYPFKIFMAILCLEAYRHDGVLVGEDLGTVPDAVRTAMERHDMHRMWVAQFEMKADPGRTFESIEPAMIAGIDTHDMPPLASYLSCKDLETLTGFGLLDAEEGDKIARERQAILTRWRNLDDPLMELIEGMARSSARYVMIGMEDIWRETSPHNIPGTVAEHPNWRRRFALPSGAWAKQGDVAAVFALLNTYRSSVDS